MDYFQRVFPEPFQILGLKLKPLSLGRYRLLHRFNCAFVADEARKASFDDLLIGVLICSMEVSEFLQWCASESFGKDIQRWRKRIFPYPWIGLIPFIGKKWRARKAPNIAHKMALFQRYIKQSEDIPAYWDETENQSAATSHWSHSMEIALRSELGWSEQEINEQPLSKAMADFFKLLESHNQIRLIDPEDLKAAEENTRLMEEAMKHSAKKGSVIPHGA